MDEFGVLRQQNVLSPIDELISEDFAFKEPVWMYTDPTEKSHIIFQSVEVFQNFALEMTTNQKDTHQAGKWLQNAVSSFKIELNTNVFNTNVLTSIDRLRLKAEANLFFGGEEFLSGLWHVIAWTQFHRCCSFKSFCYISQLCKKIVGLVNKKDIFNHFQELRSSDYVRLSQRQLFFKVACTQWPYIPSQFRHYEEVSTYHPVPQDSAASVWRRLKSGKVPVECPNNCVCLHKDSQFCSFSLSSGWQSACPNRSRMVECNHSDPLEMASCRNAEIKKKQALKCRKPNEPQSSSEIEQCIVWGVDLYTFHFIMHCLPEIEIVGHNQRKDNVGLRYDFIEKGLLKAANCCGQGGYDMGVVCEYIIAHSPKRFLKSAVNENEWVEPSQEIQSSGSDIFSIEIGEYAQHLLRHYRECPLDSVFRIHTKGKGARCINSKGITAGQFVIEYFGEIYELWRWFEKENFVKEILKNRNMSRFVPEFYNIYLQKHRDDPLGQDILVVDPSRMGTFASRFSHSCSPNCGTITTVSDGQYHIGMYALRDIAYGEELCFDYCSVTESAFEQRASICLCGMRECRGNYLQLSNSKELNALTESQGCFLVRNSLCLFSKFSLTDKQQSVKQQFNLSAQTISGMPPWMLKWMCRVLLYINKEAQAYKKDRTDRWQQLYPWLALLPETEAQEKVELYAETSRRDLVISRQQNLITTLDKLKYYLNSIKDETPPLSLASVSHTLDGLVTHNESVFSNLKRILIYKNYANEALLAEQLSSYINKAPQIKDQIMLFRLSCIVLSHTLKQIPKQARCSTDFLSDIIFFYGFTHTYFTSHQYAGHTSSEMQIAEQEVFGPKATKKRQRTCHKYSSAFVWGQVVSWYKQTILHPEASLSQDRRGTLSYPLLDTVMTSSYPFDKNTRESFIRSVRDHPGASWPCKPGAGCLSFKNPFKLYGTIFFETVHNAAIFAALPEGNLIRSCIAVIDSPLKDKLALFSQVEQLLHCHNVQEHVDFILTKMSTRLEFKAIQKPIEPASEITSRKRVKTSL